MLDTFELTDARGDNLRIDRMATGNSDRGENIFDVVRAAEREFLRTHNAPSVQKEIAAGLKSTLVHTGLSAEEPHVRRQRLQGWKHLRIVGVEHRNILARLVFEETKL